MKQILMKKSRCFIFLSTKAAMNLWANIVCTDYSSVPRSFMVKTIKNTLTSHGVALRDAFLHYHKHALCGAFSPSCCCKYSAENQMCIHAQLQIVPDKYAPVFLAVFGNDRTLSEKSKCVFGSFMSAVRVNWLRATDGVRKLDLWSRKYTKSRKWKYSSKVPRSFSAALFTLYHISPPISALSLCRAQQLLLPDSNTSQLISIQFSH